MTGSGSNSDPPPERTRFVGEPAAVAFDTDRSLEKKPLCPDRFTWRDTTYTVAELVKEWRDFSDLPRKARSSLKHGSWGVGRTYFRVATNNGRVFDLYHDRKPHGPGGQKGSWYLFREVGNLEER